MEEWHTTFPITDWRPKTESRIADLRGPTREGQSTEKTGEKTAARPKPRLEGRRAAGSARSAGSHPGHVLRLSGCEGLESEPGRNDLGPRAGPAEALGPRWEDEAALPRGLRRPGSRGGRAARCRTAGGSGVLAGADPGREEGGGRVPRGAEGRAAGCARSGLRGRRRPTWR